MRLHQALADDQAEAEPRRARHLLTARGVGISAEQVGQLFGGDAAALVGDRDRDLDALMDGGDMDRRGCRRVPRGVGEEVTENLCYAPFVGHHPGQVRRQVDGHCLPATGAQERGPRPLHQRRYLPGLGVDRQRAGLDTSGVEQVADKAAHMRGLVEDDAVELPHFGRVELPRILQQCHRRAPYGGQRLAQLVAHHAEEFHTQPLQLLQRREVLQGHHHRLDPAVSRADRRRVDQDAEAAPVGNRELHLGGSQRLGMLQIVEPDLPAVGEPRGQRVAQFLQRAVRAQQAGEDALRLAVDRQRIAGCGLEHDDAYRRGLHERLKVGSHPLLVAVRAGIGDGEGRLRGEQHQHLLVLVGERLSAFLLAEEEVPDIEAAMAHRRTLEGPARDEPRRKTERTDILPEVGQAKRPVEAAQMPEKARRLRPGRELLLLLRRQAGHDELLRPAGFVDGGNEAVARVGQRAGALDHLAQHGLDVKARADAQDGRAEAGDTRTQRLDVRVGLVAFGQVPVLLPIRCRVLYRTSRAQPPRRRRASGQERCVESADAGSGSRTLFLSR